MKTSRKFIQKVGGKLLCLIGDHQWTSKAEQGIPPDREEMRASLHDPMKGFRHYARMYCSRCGKMSELNRA